MHRHVSAAIRKGLKSPYFQGTFPGILVWERVVLDTCAWLNNGVGGVNEAFWLISR